jgi:nanoRNase/pAp phosphatase (c-di-AMP/oligoRNAs hydrolase)
MGSVSKMNPLEFRRAKKKMSARKTIDQESNAQKLLNFLSERKDILSPLLILTHDYPDPDALASAFGLAHLAQHYFGITSKIAYGGVIGRSENRAMVTILNIPVCKLRSSNLDKYRNVALVDTQPKFDNNLFPEKRRATLIIDQHSSVVSPTAELSIIDTECGATCVIVAQALLLGGESIPAKVATALAYGILSDTLDLYRARRADIIQTYLEVLHHCDMRLLAQIQNPPRSKTFFLTLGQALKHAILHRRLLVSHLGFVENPDLVAQMAEFLLTYEHAHWSFCTGRYRGRICVSLRTSKSNIKAGDILRDIFDDPRKAGGHDAIAGGSYRIGRNPSEAVWQEAEMDLQKRLFQKLHRASRADHHKPFQSGI